jgi:hypothetical protein
MGFNSGLKVLILWKFIWILEYYISKNTRKLSSLQSPFTLAHNVILGLLIPCIMSYIWTGLLPIILLLPWSRILLENVLDFQLVKKFLAIEGIQSSFTVLTMACHLLIFSATSINSTSSQPISIRHILIISSHKSYKNNQQDAAV